MKAFKPYVQFSPLIQALDGASHALQLPRESASEDNVRIVVDGTVSANLNLNGKSSSATASAANMRMLAGHVEVFTLEPGTTHIAVYGASGSTVEITMGVGI